MIICSITMQASKKYSSIKSFMYAPYQIIFIFILERTSSYGNAAQDIFVTIELIIWAQNNSEKFKSMAKLLFGEMNKLILSLLAIYASKYYVSLL